MSYGLRLHFAYRESLEKLFKRYNCAYTPLHIAYWWMIFLDYLYGEIGGVSEWNGIGHGD
jgi:hypothetical protein